jgi:hypothetical protein
MRILALREYSASWDGNAAVEGEQGRHRLAAIQPANDRSALVGAPIHAIGMLSGLLLPLYRGRAIHLTDVWRPVAVLEAMRAADLTAGS